LKIGPLKRKNQGMSSVLRRLVWMTMSLSGLGTGSCGVTMGSDLGERIVAIVGFVVLLLLMLLLVVIESFVCCRNGTNSV
jgi:DMSO/TMAO reductase YedYZ heme-binding membrane subunit